MSKNTKNATAFWIRQLDDRFKARTGDVLDWDTCPKPVLASSVDVSYVNARQRNGSVCKTNTLLAARGSIQRHIPPLSMILMCSLIRNSANLIVSLTVSSLEAYHRTTVLQAISMSEAIKGELSSFFSF